jgi:hypothetical protein
VGYQVEYLIDLPPAPAREWLSALDGWWATPESSDELPWGEFAWGGQALHADLGPVAGWVRVPCIKYSWLIHGDEPSVEWVTRFERYLCATLPGIRMVRLDELVRIQWEAWAGREWAELPDPVGSLWGWLPTHEYGSDYFRLLPAEQRHAKPGTAPANGA